jgi:hypothetical protein
VSVAVETTQTRSNPGNPQEMGSQPGDLRRDSERSKEDLYFVGEWLQESQRCRLEAAHDRQRKARGPLGYLTASTNVAFQIYFEGLSASGSCVEEGIAKLSRFLAAILDTPVSRQGSGSLRQPVPILCGSENIHSRKIFRRVRRWLAKGRQQLGRNQRRNVMLLETQEKSGFPSAQPRGKAPAIKESKRFC